ncbi:MAG TPA: hypothetical protein PKI14_14420 [Fervidobacterium sp.]|nr:hypothetical protein [Fervidobacterium sp.]
MKKSKFKEGIIDIIKADAKEKEEQKKEAEKKRQQKKLRGSARPRTDAAAYGICETCNEEFKQDWYETKKRWSTYKKCPACRSKLAYSKVKEKYLEGTIEYVPHEGQNLVHKSKARFKVIAAGARWGKDRCCMMEFIFKFAQMLSEDRGEDLVPKVHAWLIAPTYRMSRQIWREFKYYFPRQWIVEVWETDKMLETINGGIIEVRSADDPDALVGTGLDMVLITEAGRIVKLEEVWANIETRLMSPGRGPNGTGGLALINSVPRGRNFFHRMYRWGQKGDTYYDPDWESWNFPSFANPYLATNDIEYFDRIKNRFPERFYRQEVLAEFIAEGNSVFPTADDCADYRGSSEPVHGEIYVIGYDPAKEVDFSGVVVRNSYGEVVNVMQWTGKPWPVQVEEITRLSRYYNYATVVIDKTGIGEALPSMLEQNGVIVDAVHFTSAVKERLVNHLAMLIEQKAISYPDHAPLLEELKDYQYLLTKTGFIRYSASTSKKHDDLVTAMILAFKDYNKPEIVLPYMGMLGGLKKKTFIA